MAVNRTSSRAPSAPVSTSKPAAPKTTKATTNTASAAPATGTSWAPGAKASAAPATAMPASVAAWNKRGLTMSAGALVDGAMARLAKPMSAKALAAAVFGLPEAQVGERHWQLLVSTNPSLAQVPLATGKVKAGQNISLAATEAALEVREQSLTTGLEAGNALLEKSKHARAGSTDRLSDTELLTLTNAMTGLGDELTRVKQARSTRGLESLLGQAEARAAQAINAQGITAAFAPFAAELAKRTEPSQAAARTTMERELVLSTSAAFVDAANKAAGSGNLTLAKTHLGQARQSLDGLLARTDLPADTRAAVRSQKAALHAAEGQLYLSAPELMNGLLKSTKEGPARDQRINQVVADTGKAYLAADAELKTTVEELKTAIASAGANTAEGKAAAAQLDAVTRLRSSMKYEALGVAADLRGAGGDPKGQLRTLSQGLTQAMGLPAETVQRLLTPDETKRITNDAEEREWYRVDQLFSTNKVGFLGPAKIDAFADAIQKLPVAQRDEALEALCRYADTAAGVQDLDAMNVSRQLLNELSSRLKLPPLKVQAAIADAEYVCATGDLTDGAAGFAAAVKLAKALPDSDIRPAIEARALFGHANALQQLASGGGYREREAAAKTLSALRASAEKSGPFNRDQLSRLVMMEMSGFLGANLSEDAAATLTHLKKTYVAPGDVPWLTSAVADFEKQNSDWKPAAFLQVALAESNSESMGEALGYGLGGAAAGAGVGAAVGVWFFGVGAIPGAALGAMIGGAAGTLGLKTRNVIRGWDKIGDAGRTGLNSQTAMQSVMDGVSLGLDIVSIVAPIKGVGSIGKAGLSALTKTGAEAASDAGGQLLADLATEAQKSVVATLGQDAAANMASKEFQRMGKEVLLRQIARETLEFGGKKVALAGLGLAATPFVTELWRIETSDDMTKAQKSAARNRLAQNLGQAAMSMGVMMASSTLINHYATNPAGATKELRAALADISVNDRAVLVKGVQVNTVKPDKTVRNLLLEGFVENVLNAPEWLGKTLENKAGFDDLNFLQHEAPEAVEKVMKAIADRFVPSEEQTFSFGNSGYEFNGQIDTKEFFGVCAGLTLTRRRINLLAFFDEGGAQSIEKCPFDATTQPKEFTNFYKARLDDIVKNNKAAFLPGFANLNELSSHPLLKPIVKELVLREWGVNNASPYKGVYKMLGGVTREKFTYEEGTALLKQINDSKKLGPNPVIWLSSHAESMFSTKQWIHVMEAVSATQEVPGGPITIKAWDPNSTNLGGMTATIVIHPDGKAMLGGRELNQVSVLPGDGVEVAKGVANRVKFAIKNPTLVKPRATLPH